MRAYLAGVSYRLSNKTERDVQTTARISMAPLMGPHTMFVSNWLPQG